MGIQDSRGFCRSCWGCQVIKLLFRSCVYWKDYKLRCSMKQIREDVKQEDTVVKAKTTHHSQTDAAKGFGGKYGVQKERQDKVFHSIIVHRCVEIRPIKM